MSSALLGLLGLLAMARATDPYWGADLEVDNGGFGVEGNHLLWNWGSGLVGPGSCHGGTNCWGTGAEGYYLNNSAEYLIFPDIDLTGLPRPSLRFYHWYRILENDFAAMDVDLGSGWEPISPVYGYPTADGYTGVSDGWEPVYLDLGGLSSLGQVRLAFTSDASASSVGWYVDDFAVFDDDVVPPSIDDLTILADTEDLLGPYPIQATIRDDQGPIQALMIYSVDGGTEVQVTMDPLGADLFEASIPGQPAATAVAYQIRATDGVNESSDPEDPVTFRVRLPAPTDLVAEGEVVRAFTCDFTWSAPKSAHIIEGYRVYRDGSLVSETADLGCQASLVSGDQEFQVTAVYDVGEGDPTDPVSVFGAVPTIVSLSPEVAYQGDRMRLTLLGQYLLMQQGSTSASLGAGVEIQDLEVRDVDLAWLTVSVDETAAQGPRDIQLLVNGEVVGLEGAFTVMDGADRPHLVSLEPSSMRQGESATLVVTASGSFQDLPSVYMGESIVVEAVRQVTASQIQVDVAVPVNAPLGAHAIEVDDGVRIFSGLDLDVDDVLVTVGNDCACETGRRGSGWRLLSFVGGALLALWRRAALLPARALSR